MTDTEFFAWDDSLAWPAARLAEAIEILAHRAGFEFIPPTEPMPILKQPDDESLNQWLETAAARLGFEMESVTAVYNEVPELVRKAGPAIIRLPGQAQDSAKFLLLLKGGPWRVSLIKPDLSMQRVSINALVNLLRRDADALLSTKIDQLLESAEVAVERRDQARKVILGEQLSAHQVGGCWLLRLSPAGNFWQQMQHALVPRKLTLLLAAHATQQGLLILGWWMIVEGALQGNFDAVWLAAWGLVLLTSIPFQISVVWLQSLLTVTLGVLFKQRLLFGTLQLYPEEVKHQGIGQFLGRVLEAETLETMMLGGGFAALIASVQFLAALVVLSLGAGGWLHAFLLIIWLALTFFLSWRYYQQSADWRRGHRHMINALIERMVGHRTRLAQEDPHSRHDDEDQTLSGYMQLSTGMDSTMLQLSGFINRGWLVLGLAGLSYALLSNKADPVLIAASLGGIMLASQAINTLLNGMESVVGVLNAWKQVGPLFHAAARGKGEARIDPLLKTPSDNTTDSSSALLIARDLVFRYRDYGQAVLNGCDIQVRHNDRLLLEGSSGGGKSTLAALLTGLRNPTSGLLLLRGLDRQTLGNRAWRKRLVSAPQFHENHILTETFAFNLLMGRGWPPSAGDLQEAEKLCLELGLGNLLQRMPAGLQQMIGESGWQLSHGERSRLFIARALLQRADMIILDESFAALDPENLERALRCVLERAPALMVIAHP